MTQLMSRIELKDYRAIATDLSQELAATAIERDKQAGVPTEEVKRLRETGLLTLTIPREYGGVGMNWLDAHKIVQELSKADGSIGQLYGNHIDLVVIPQIAGTPAQAEYYYRISAQNHLFWGNAVNTRDTRLKMVPEGNYLRVNGIKAFGTGTVSADLRVFSAIQEGLPKPVFFILPSDREGVTYNHDWDCMGQRRTASGSFTFDNVLVHQDEVLGPPVDLQSGFPTLTGVITALTKTYVYLGIAEGALAAAKVYTINQTRPWFNSGVDSATKDPYILRQYGELWTELQAAIALADQATLEFQRAWDKGQALTPTERGELAVSISAAKSFAIRVGLNLTTRIFEVMGARSTAASYGFDRYWRDLRTFSLHDPIDYKLQNIGNWVLNQAVPLPTQYS
jgi:alkylation response protein AidB-like acyl-CoA dehydrogenase